MDEGVKDNKQLKDEQELAKVLAGINSQAATGAAPTALSDDPEEIIKSFDEMAPMSDPIEGTPMPEMAMPTSTTPASDLESIKQSAINDLRPLVDKLELPEDEKFTTYLLLIRSTNDSTLIAPAYAVAKQIADDTKRAQALLDIVKEIDYFTNPPVQAEIK